MPDEKSTELSSRFTEALDSFSEAAKLDDIDSQQAVGLRFMDVVCEEIGKDPDFLNSPIVVVSHLEQRGEWRRVRSLLEAELAKHKVEDCSACRLLQNLAAVYWLFGEQQRPLELLRRALKAAETFDLTILIRMVSRPLIETLLKTGAVSEAKGIVDHTLAIDTNTRSEFWQSTADLFVLQGRCLIELQQLEAAERRFEGAWSLLAKYDTALAMFGVQSSVAAYWMAMARLHRVRGSKSDVLDSMQKAIAKWRWIALTPFDHSVWAELSLARALQTFADDLWRAGRRFKSLAARWESRRVFARFHLDANGRVPRGIASRLPTWSVWLYDRGLVRLQSFFCRGECPVLDTTQ